MRQGDVDEDDDVETHHRLFCAIVWYSVLHLCRIVSFVHERLKIIFIWTPESDVYNFVQFALTQMCCRRRCQRFQYQTSIYWHLR